jgi:hypothetical protein
VGIGALLVPAMAAPAAGDEPACEPSQMVGLGLACLHHDGLFELFAPDGTSLGFTHGGDPPLEPLAAEDVPPAPSLVCAEEGDAYHTRVIYARARDGADRYASMAPRVRAGVASAAALLGHAADDSGGSGGAIEVACSGNAVAVDNVRLDTSASRTTPSTIMADLRTAGYTDGRLKLWVLYDNTNGCACAGIANIYFDDRKGAENLNNGNGSIMTAINFGRPDDARVWMHELAHTLGAVQISAPRTTGAGHCIDGRDTLCYDDGGSRGRYYSTTKCSVEVFDCGKDDYFNVSPPAGSYLDTFWNLGGPNIRYVIIYTDASATFVDPRPGVVYMGCGTVSSDFTSVRAGAGTYVERGCVRVRPTAASVESVSVFFDNAFVTTVAATAASTVEVEFPHPFLLATTVDVDVLLHHTDGTTGRIHTTVDAVGV